METLIVSFSQTGNTRKVGRAMAEAMAEAGFVVRTISFKKVTAEDFLAADLIGVGAPCFESQAPTPVRDFLVGLPDLKGRRAFVFATAGGAPGRVLWDMARPLKQRGAEVLGGFLCRGTCYHPIPCLVGRFPERPDETDLEKARRFAASVAEMVQGDDPRSVPAENRLETLNPGLGLYDIAGLALKDPLIRFLMPKPRVDSDACDQCGWCVHECPTASIILHSTPEIGGQCIRCYRCLTGCPKNAFSVNWWFSNPVVWSLYNQTFEHWFGDIRKGERVY
ncbi:MAG: EFR1 family ferrodoxin [Desulfobacterales bacterium]|nr:EFR1 family ferrodoxin [Desulfobacterales bacterium]